MMKTADANHIIKRLQEGDVFLVSEKGIKHTIIKALQRSRWNHVLLYIGKGRTIEVTPRNGAHICDLMHDLTEKPYIAWKVLRNKKLTQAQRRKIIATALRLFNGKKFSAMQYARIILGRTLHWKNANNSHVCKPGHKCNTGSLVCSNMVAMAYYEAGFPIGETHMPEYVVPKDYEMAKTLKVVFTGENKELA